MEIKTGKSASDSIIETAKVLWKIYAKGFMKFYLTIGSSSIILLLLGIFDFESPTITILNSEYHLYLHLSLIIGIGLLFSLLYLLAIMSKSKRAYFQDANRSAIAHKEIESIVYKLNDQNFTIDTQLTVRTTNWGLFIHKELIGDLVILYRSRSPLHAFVIDCQSLDPTTKEKLNAFLDEKFKK